MSYTVVERISNDICYRGYGKSGQRVQKRIPFQPALFLPCDAHKATHRTVTGDPVTEVRPGSMYDCGQFIRKYDGVVSGNDDYVVQFIGEIEPDGGHKCDVAKLRIATVDIETEYSTSFPEPSTAYERINVITIAIKHGQSRKRWVLVVGEVDVPSIESYCSSQALPADTAVKRFDSEDAMLAEFLCVWRECDMDVVTGWNVELFDVPYLYNRIARVLGKERADSMSPWGKCSTRTADIMGREHEIVQIYGVATLDYIRLYRKYAFTSLDSYSLDTVANHELGERKIDYKELGFASIRDFYERDLTSFVTYNVRDVDLVEKLDNRRNLIELHVSIAYMAGANYEDVFGQVKQWDCIIYHHLRRMSVVVPMKRHSDKADQFAGAYVKEPKPGKYDWVMSFDLNSLYPSIIRACNICPSTIVPRDEAAKLGGLFSGSVDDLLEHKYRADWLGLRKLSMGANGQYYRSDVAGFLPELMRAMYAGRVAAKKKMLDAKKEIERVKHEIESRKGSKV